MSTRAYSMLTVVATILLSSCGFVGLKDEPGTTTGEIFVSGPAVDTRERLISDRQTQYVWLQQQLKNSDDAEFGINGEHARKSATTFSANANAKLDPTSVALSTADTANQLAALKQAGRLQNLDYQIETQKRKLILKNAENETDPDKIVIPASTPPTPQPSTVPAAIDSGAPKATADGNKALVDVMAAALAPASSGSISSTPIDLFRDRLAYREEIRNEMIAYGWDDRHDIRGNALYRISFDATVLPADDTSAWAIVSVCVQRPGSERCQPASESDKSYSSSKRKTAFDVADAAALKRALVADFESQKAQLFADLENRIFDPKGKVDLNTLSRRSKALVLTGSQLVLTVKKVPADADTNTKEWKTKSGGAISLKNTRRVLQAMTENGKSSGPVSLDTLIGPMDEVCEFLDKGSFTLDAPPIHVDHDLLSGACLDKGKNAKLLLLEYLGVVGLIVETKNSLISQYDGTLSPTTFFTKLAAKSAQTVAPTVTSKPPAEPEATSAQTAVPSTLPAIPAATTEPLEKDGRISFQDNELVVDLDLQEIVNEKLKRSSLEIYAYGATPKESVQRISDVVTRREGVQLALGLQALAGNVGVSTLTNFMNTNEGVFNALRRQPLVVGFGSTNPNSFEINKEGHAPADFGWIIGPRYGTSKDGKSANFRHTVVQNGLSAIISIPGWWDKAEVFVHRYWVDRLGKTLVGQDSADSKAIPTPVLKYTIAMPSSADDILNILAGDAIMRVQEERTDQSAWKVKVGAHAEIMVRGKNLWRNPQVRLGSQFADSVKLMPDMEGVVAIFSSVSETYGAPLTFAGRAGPRDTVPVTIATPAGFALVGFAEMVKDPAPAKKLSIDGGAVLIGRAVNTFSLNMPLPGYWNIQSRYRAAGTTQAFTIPKAEIARPKNDRLTYKVGALSNIKAGEPVELQLLITYAKGDEPDTLSVDGTLAYYPSAKDWKISITSISPSPTVPNKDPTTYTLLLKFPAGYAKAFGAADGKVSFTAADKPELGPFSCTVQKDSTCRLEMALPANIGVLTLSLAPSGLKDNVPNPFDGPIKEPQAPKAATTKMVDKTK